MENQAYNNEIQYSMPNIQNPNTNINPNFYPQQNNQNNAAINNLLKQRSGQFRVDKTLNDIVNNTDTSNVTISTDLKEKAIKGVLENMTHVKGTPEEVCKVSESYTGKFLKPLL